MSKDRIADVVEPRTPHRLARRSSDQRGLAGVLSNLFHTSTTQDDVEDKARWLDGQVRGWTAARTL